MQQTQTITNGVGADWHAVARDHVVAMRAYFESGATQPIEWRLGQLKAIDRFLVEREADILRALAEDLGKPAMEGFAAEVGLTRMELKYTIKRLRKWMRPTRVPTPLVAQPGKSFIHHEPLGVVLIISPWNYPFQLLMAPLIGAIAAGNCAMLKPSEVATKTSALFAHWIPKYLDTSAVKVMQGAIPETTALLEQHWDHIFYTGNGTVARIIMQAAAKHLTPVTLELGGKSPCLVDEDADLDEAAKRIVFGKFYNAGQTCVAPDHVLVHDKVHDALINRMVTALREFFGDNPQNSADYGRIINERHHGRIVKLLNSGSTVVGGEHDVADRYIAPTILRDVSEDDPVMQEEIFGPVLPVLSVANMKSAIASVNRRDKPLALYIFSKNKAIQDEIIAHTSAGGTTVNHVWMHLAVPELPFGGVGPSGMGAYHGKASFEVFSHRRSILRKPSGLEPPIMYPPYTDWKLRLIRLFV